MRADAWRNRERLLEVAAEAFAVGGLAVPLDEIAKRAGVGPGTLYRHFPTREALFEAVVRDRLAALVNAARRTGEESDPGTELFALIDRMVVEGAPKKDLIDALVGAGVDVRTGVEDLSGQLRDALGELLVRAQEQGSVRSDVGLDELMALLSGVLFALHGNHRTADPGVVLAVLRDGLRQGE